MADDFTHDYNGDPINVEDETQKTKDTQDEPQEKPEPTQQPMPQMDQKHKDRIALVISIIFVLALGFFAYRYFSNADSIDSGQEGASTEETAQNTDQTTDENIMATNTEREIQELLEREGLGDATIGNGTGGTDTPTTNDNNVGNIESGNQEGGSVAGTNDVANTVTESVFVWTAIDYEKGDVGTGEHTVQSGDTLWELAEAAYGDGTQWTRIRDANSSSVDYLPSGQQALIFVGQTLIIPA